MDRSEDSPEEAPDLWAEALWGAGLLGSVLLVVLVSLIFRLKAQARLGVNRSPDPFRACTFPSMFAPTTGNCASAEWINAAWRSG